MSLMFKSWSEGGAEDCTCNHCNLVRHFKEEANKLEETVRELERHLLELADTYYYDSRFPACVKKWIDENCVDIKEDNK